jgi:hypothetical protein
VSRALDHEPGRDDPALRHAALARAHGMRDPRVAEVLRRARLRVRPREGATWESSDGTVRAVDLRVIVDGHALGLCDAYPSVLDAVVEAITAEAPVVLEASVIDLDVRWGLAEHAVESGYRDELVREADRASGTDVRRAIAGYLIATGDEPTARAVSGPSVRVAMLGGRPRVEGIGAERAAAIEAAIAALWR